MAQNGGAAHAPELEPPASPMQSRVSASDAHDIQLLADSVGTVSVLDGERTTAPTPSMRGGGNVPSTKE